MARRLAKIPSLHDADQVLTAPEAYRILTSWEGDSTALEKNRFRVRQWAKTNAGNQLTVSDLCVIARKYHIVVPPHVPCSATVFVSGVQATVEVGQVQVFTNTKDILAELENCKEELAKKTAEIKELTRRLGHKKKSGRRGIQ